MRLPTLALSLVVLVASYGWWTFVNLPQPVTAQMSEVLPAQEQAQSRVQQEMVKAAGNRLLVAIYAAEADQLDAEVENFLEGLLDAPVVGLEWQLDRREEAVFADFLEALVRHESILPLLSVADRRALQTGDFTGLDSELNDFLHGLTADLRVAGFAADPYNFSGRAVTATHWSPSCPSK